MTTAKLPSTATTPSYLDAARRPAKAVSAPSASATACLASGLGRAGVAPEGNDEVVGGEGAVGHVRSWCVAYLCGLWRVAPLLANIVVDGSLPLTLTGGGRNFTNSKQGRLSPRLCLAPANCSACSLEKSPWSFLGDASTVCPLLIK